MEKMDPDLGHEHFLQFYSVLIQKNSKIKLSLFLVERFGERFGKTHFASLQD